MRRMIRVEQLNFFDEGILVIDENFEIEISKQIKIHFVTIVADRHHKRSLLIEKIYFSFQRKFSIVAPPDHTST